MYKILFIDEEKENLEYFEEFVEDFRAKTKLKALTELPLEDKEEMIELIIKLAPDALISDFLLNEKRTAIDYNVPYNGVELIKEFQSIRTDFPCFVLTAFDDKAVNQSDDVNIVYVKNILHNKEEGNAKATFLDRVVSQIEHYKKKIENAKNELTELVKVRKAGEVNIEIENRIITLDNFLEKSIDARNAIPAEFKTLSNSTRLDNILTKVDDLLNKLGENE